MKIKRWIAMISAILLFALIGVGTMRTFIVNDDTMYASTAIVDKKSGTIFIENDRIRILQLTDIQTYTLSDCAAAYPQVKKIVEKVCPDMIVLTGDNIADNSSYAVLSAMVDLFDSFKTPWALVFGNHDRNSNVPMPEICKALEKTKYGLFKTGNLHDRYGNYTYTISLQGEPVRSLIFMDSAKTNFTNEQVDWYKNTVNSLPKKSGKVLPSFAFFHIPILETLDAHALYAQDSTIGTGVTNEAICPQTENTGFFDAVKSLGSTDALFYGHDHINNTILKYQDVLFCYGLKTGPNSYYSKEMQGGTLITVTSDNFQVEHIYLN